MVTIAQVVKKMVNERPMLQESMRQGLISFAALAEKFKEPVESELGMQVKESAIMMALRRYSEALEKLPEKKIISMFSPDIVMRTGMVDIVVAKSDSLASKLERLYAIVDFSRGDVLNLVHGNYEVNIITNEKKMDAVLKVLAAEKILMKEKNLVAITMSISKEHVYTPGTIFAAVRKLAWDNVNLFEIISTRTELVFIVNSKDAVRAYNSLQEMVGSG